MIIVVIIIVLLCPWEIEKAVILTHIPILAFVEENQGESKETDVLFEILATNFPIYKYLRNPPQFQLAIEDSATYDLIIRNEGADENIIDENMRIALEEENEQLKQEKILQGEKEAIEPEEKVDSLKFVKATTKAKEYNWEEYKDFETLIKEFYIVDSTVSIGPEQFNVEIFTDKNMILEQTTQEEPQILIYHTHSQEAFVDSIPGDANTSIIGAGKRLAEILEEEYGYQVLHHTGEYDIEGRDYAYTEAQPAIEQILKENESIEVVIDLHRDGVRDDLKLVSEVGGRQTAQFMFLNGLSKTKERGEITYLPNANLEDNLAFAFQLQTKANEYYPNASRRIYLRGYRYNLHFKPKNLLIELGAQTNTVEEIMNACDPIAHIIDMVLSGEEP